MIHKPERPTRAERKAKKRKRTNAIPNLPGENNGTETVKPSSKKRKFGELEADPDSIDGDKPATKEKKHERQKRLREERRQSKAANSEKAGNLEQSKDQQSKDEHDTVTEAIVVDNSPEPKLSKKERKATKKTLEAEKAAEDNKKIETEAEAEDTISKATATLGTESEARGKKVSQNQSRDKKTTTSANGSAKDPKAGKDKADPRFIAFIGNLPFSATTESITAHFGAVKPKFVRHLTLKNDPSKSRGCAFVEFDGYDHMKTCLKLFHHSTFDDGISPPRKINVELTAGGGGNTKDRKAKIQGKNQKLTEQRIRRMQEEEKAKLAKNGGNITSTQENGAGIHPSRLALLPGHFKD